ncbi:MAG TPA: hypothetical protein VIM73_14215, partial [Polyangiaceae bacterium]
MKLERSHVFVATLAACSFHFACSTQGSGTGELKPASGVAAAEPIRFSWHSEGGSVTRGTLTTDVPGKGTFTGKYMQITSQSDAVGAGSYFDEDWHPGWYGWDGWGDSDEVDTFVTNYSGKVISVLRSGTGESMRCRFRLAEPASGPAGGGVGECELSDGDKIDNV